MGLDGALVGHRPQVLIPVYRIRFITCTPFAIRGTLPSFPALYALTSYAVPNSDMLSYRRTGSTEN